jgi:hypothetical protein
MLVSSGALTGGKTFLRSTMSHERLNSVYCCYLFTRILSPDIKSAMAEFIWPERHVRRRIFGDMALLATARATVVFLYCFCEAFELVVACNPELTCGY